MAVGGRVFEVTSWPRKPRPIAQGEEPDREWAETARGWMEEMERLLEATMLPAGYAACLDPDQLGALTDNMPFDNGAVVYTDSAGALDTDATHFAWDASAKTLSIDNDGNYFAVVVSGYDSTYSYWRPHIQVRRARGSVAGGPSAVLSGDYLGEYEWDGYGATDWGIAARIIVRASENWTDSAQGAYMTFLVSNAGATGVDTQFHAAEGQIRALSGSAGAPSVSFWDYEDQGMYAKADGYIGWATAGAGRMVLDPTGRLAVAASGRGVFDPGYEFDFESDVAGISTLMHWNRDTGAAHARMYQITEGTGDNYFLLRVPSSVYWAFGIDNSDAGDRFCWAPATTLGASDVMRLERTGVWWLYPHASPSLTADGELGVDSSRKAWKIRAGDTNGFVSRQIDVDTSTYTVNATASETVVASCTVDTDDFAVGKTFHVYVSGYCSFPSSGPGVTHYSTLKVKLAGVTLYDDDVIFIPVETSAGTSRWVVRADISVWTLGSSGSCAYGITQNSVLTGGASAGGDAAQTGTATINTTANTTLQVTIQHDDNLATKYTYVYVREVVEA